MRYKLILISSVLPLLGGCACGSGSGSGSSSGFGCACGSGSGSGVQSRYSDPRMWCCFPESAGESADVFYLTSTDVIQSFGEDGSESRLAVLNEAERAAMAAEINYIHAELFPDSLNYYAPYYHQVTLKALLDAGPEEFDVLIDSVGAEICAAFDYYMATANHGRPFVLAGFSQGAILLETLLNHMTDRQYERMVAAYMLGYGLDSEALSSPRVKPATGAFDKGVTVSFNSVRDTAAVWDLVQNRACACINPANWATDATPAIFEYGGDTLTATVDTLRHLVTVDGFPPEKYAAADLAGAPWPRGCYHLFEIFFYNRSIRRNVLDRCR